MSKKDLANVTTDLSSLASMMPTQRPIASVSLTSAPPPFSPAAAVEPSAAVPGPLTASKPRPRADDTTQFSLSLRKSLRKQLAKLASDSDMTMRAFVLNALKEKGLSVRDDDLADMRKERR
jgi:hypothetical protein